MLLSYVTTKTQEHTITHTARLQPHYLFFTVCVQPEQWLLQLKLVVGSNAHPSF